MTPEERDIIGRFIARVGGGAPAASITGSVPATQTALPPIDPDADRFIGEQFGAFPSARYRVTQMAFVQEAALAEAQNRIKRLEYDLQNAQAQAQAAPQQSQSRGLFGGLFGGGQSAPRPAYQPQYAPPPQASYPPGYQPGMFQSGGSGFLGSALTTAAGVAGGVLAADAISSMFSPHGYGMGGGFGGGGFGGGGWGGGGGEVINETTVNNYGEPDAGGGGGGADPWAGSGTSDTGGGWDQGGQADAGGGGDAWGGAGAADSGGGDAGWDDSGGGGGDGSF